MRRARIGFFVAFAAVAVPTNADASTFFLFDRPSAEANERLTIRSGGTPKDFRPKAGARLGRPIRLYLVPSASAPTVRTRFDSRLQFVGSLRPDARGRGTLTFSVPSLDAGVYDIAYWCPACARYSKGRTFFAQEGDKFVEPYRSQALLRITTTTPCAVTVPNGHAPRGYRGSGWTFYGNGLLAASVPASGVYTHEERNGGIGAKLIWIADLNVGYSLRVRYQRIDVPGRPVDAVVVSGTLSGFAGPSWASRMSFSEGCWRVTGWIRDVRLTFVMRVARA